MIDSTLTATRVQGGWQLFTESGHTVKFTGQYFHNAIRSSYKGEPVE